MRAEALSKSYRVRRLVESDVDDVFRLCRENTLFYEYHPPMVTPESILEDLVALPPGKEMADKYFVGFFRDGALAAVLDLVLDYPKKGTAFLGFFMTDRKTQGKGVGSRLLREIEACLTGAGFTRLRLAIDKGNPQSEAFWTKNGFRKTGEEYPADTSVYVPMEKALARPNETEGIV